MKLSSKYEVGQVHSRKVLLPWTLSLPTLLVGGLQQNGEGSYKKEYSTIYGFNRTKQKHRIENGKDKEIPGCQHSSRTEINQSKQVQDVGRVWSDTSQGNTKQIDCSMC